MNILISAAFTKNGTPQDSLSPIISIIKLSNNSLIVSGAFMDHSVLGVYKYNFTTSIDNENYAVQCDGGNTLTDIDRYKYASFDTEIIVDNSLIL